MSEASAHELSASDQRYVAGLHPTDNSEGENVGTHIVDRGRQAWLTLVGCWIVQFCTYGWIGSFQLFMQYIPGVVVGKAFDAGYFRYMIAIGTFLQVVSMFMLSLARPHKYYEVFLAQAVGMGLGQSFLFLPSLTIIGHHFKHRRALATGIAVSGASFGGVVWPILLNHLIQRTSFANSVRATAALCGLMLFASNFLMKPRSTTRSNLLCQVDMKSILADPAYLISVMSAFCINLGLFFPYFYLQLYASNRKIDSPSAFYSIAILNAGGVLGRILPNVLADKLGTYNLLLPCLFISAGLAFAMLAISTLSGLLALAALFGFSSGSCRSQIIVYVGFPDLSADISLIPSLLVQLSNHTGEHG
ncbi:hypothetical protein CVT26_005547 [Gymnopilus dilepis]|uniref:Major facilitator superfamily (MFS) profile domain-containing protein n=1 Tax=Gymnopilus dilepis TaxID=231916 RepID=A0A409XZR3_9AGAR|nr:hypothetical protein CVT26_005547 [Gymnopilus dilepis]